MDRGDYRQESFLDDRMLAAKRASQLCNLDQMVAAAAKVTAPPAAWIFHIGHVGSTLISRLLGEMDGVLAIREPRALRDLMESSDQERPALASALSRLMSRRGNDDRHVLVKATSFVSEMAPLLVEPEAAAIFVHASPSSYISGILAGENSRRELESLHAIRVNRLASRGIALGEFGQDDAHRAALAWACEMTSLEAAAESLTRSHMLWTDFDMMLGDVSGWLTIAADYLGISIEQDRIDEIASGPLMSRYSKALEYDYSPSLRAELLAEAMRDHLREINAAIAALRDASGLTPLLERALRRADGEI